MIIVEYIGGHERISSNKKSPKTIEQTQEAWVHII